MGVHPTVTPQRVLFRVDAGSSIGLGHLQRCLSLALALQREGSRCVFLGLPEAVAESIVAGAGLEFIPLNLNIIFIPYFFSFSFMNCGFGSLKTILKRKY